MKKKTTGSTIPSYGVVIPTLGERPAYFSRAITSCKSSGNIHVSVCGPKALVEQLPRIDLADDLIFSLEGIGLEAKIREAFRMMPDHIKFVSWLGDDDLLVADQMSELVALMEKDQDLAVGYGQCEFIDSRGEKLFVAKPGERGIYLSSLGPQIVPQPSTVYRRSLIRENDLMRSDFSLAFDLDLLLSLWKLGDHVYLPKVTASWRWHSTSSTVRNRFSSAREGARVRNLHRIGLSKIVLFPYDALTGIAIFLWGQILNIAFKVKEKWA